MEPVNGLILRHRTPIDCTYEKEMMWPRAQPGHSITAIRLEESRRITLLLLTVHLNHFNTVIILKFSNIIFKSLGEKKRKREFSFPLPNAERRESEWMEKKVIWEIKVTRVTSSLKPKVTHSSVRLQHRYKPREMGSSKNKPENI